MKNARLALALALGLGFSAAQAGSLDISGSPVAQKQIERHAAAIQGGTGVEVAVSSVGSAKGMMELAEGKTRVAAISMSLDEAVAAARHQAKLEGKSIRIPANLRYHAVQRGAETVGFVTVGAPAADVQRVLDYLASREGQTRLASR